VSNREERLPPHRAQHILGFIIAAYGFFVGIFPENYGLPFIPHLTTSQSNIVAAALLLVGAFLLVTNRRIVKV
jgi:hypothetical protein